MRSVYMPLCGAQGRRTDHSTSSSSSSSSSSSPPRGLLVLWGPFGYERGHTFLVVAGERACGFWSWELNALGKSTSGGTRCQSTQSSFSLLLRIPEINNGGVMAYIDALPC
jgi:hypothetical protein